MSTLLWNTPEKLKALLCELVSWDSRTLTEGERGFTHKLLYQLKQLNYFASHPDQLLTHEADLGRYLLTALYKHPAAVNTIVLISHFDTVAIEEYGDLAPLAFQAEALTEKLLERKADLPQEARDDLESGEYLFGRGTMDMKMGLALHMQLLEKASTENWPINLLLLTVPDEEVNSAGMRAAVPVLVKLREQFNLTYQLFLNSEPSFSQMPGDEKHYIYSGTIGKILPGALFYGKESHVGEPLKGMTANYISSFLMQEMEWNPDFFERDFGETTPLPVSLYQKDLNMQYSTQTPYRAAALYNVFLMKRTPAEVMDLFEKAAQKAAVKCNAVYRDVCRREGVSGLGDVKVIRYEALLQYGIEKMGAQFVSRLERDVLRGNGDEREKSIQLADKLMIECQELAPAIVLLFAPPYYPAVNSSDSLLVKDLAATLKSTAAEFDLELSQIHYFNGICDLSYVNYEHEDRDWEAYERNSPVWGELYSIPFQEMTELKAPVLNVGPFGKDAHQRTERLHMDSAFVHTPYMLEQLIKSLAAAKS